MKHVDTNEPVEQERFAGLNNKEILTVYYRFRGYADNLEKQIKNKKLVKIVNEPNSGMALATKNLSDEHIQKFKETEFYQMVYSILDKLAPIVQIIEECDQSVKHLIDEIR